MRIEVERYGHGRRSTLGRLSVDGEPFCYVLEDEHRVGPKVPGRTRIPDGEYLVTLQRAGRIHEAYKDRFRGMHDGVLLLEGVPGFEGIVVHVGNTHEDTAGCPLVGEDPGVYDDGEFWVGGSERAYRRLYPLVRDEIRAGRTVTWRVWSWPLEGRTEGAT